MKYLNPSAFLLASCMLIIEGKKSNTNDGTYGHGMPDNPIKIIPKGAKEFTYKGITVTALTEKRAINKIEKKLKKQQYNENI